MAGVLNLAFLEQLLLFIPATRWGLASACCWRA